MTTVAIIAFILGTLCAPVGSGQKPDSRKTTLKISGLSGGVGALVQGVDEKPVKDVTEYPKGEFDEKSGVWTFSVRPGTYILHGKLIRLSWTEETLFEKRIEVPKGGAALSINLQNIEHSVVVEPAEKEKLLRHHLFAVIKGVGPINQYYLVCSKVTIRGGELTWAHRVAEPGLFRAYIFDSNSARMRTLETDSFLKEEYSVEPEIFQK